jgi:hypothetical protein
MSSASSTARGFGAGAMAGMSPFDGRIDAGTKFAPHLGHTMGLLRRS